MEFDLLQALNTGALIAFTFLFVKGEIISKRVVNQILEEANNRTDKLTAEIKQGIKDAVREGIVEGHHIIKNGR